MKVVCVYKVVKSVLIDVDDKYEKLVTDFDSDLENDLHSKAYRAINELEGGFADLEGVYDVNADKCLVEG